MSTWEKGIAPSARMIYSIGLENEAANKDLNEKLLHFHILSSTITRIYPADNWEVCCKYSAWINNMLPQGNNENRACIMHVANE